jgi:hypothetical protein
MLFAFISLSLSVCEVHGVHLEFGNVDRDLATAYYDSQHDSGSHYIVFTGSFMPKVSGKHTFTVTCYTYFTSMLVPAVAHLEWDQLPVKSGQNTWTWDTELQKDFRYSYKCTTDDNYYYATLELDVQPPDVSNRTVDTEYSDTCTVIGCRNLSLTRADNCEPTDGTVARKIERPMGPLVDRSRGVPIGPVIGLVVGGVAVVAVIGGVVVGMRWWKRRTALAKVGAALLSGKDGDVAP